MKKVKQDPDHFEKLLQARDGKAAERAQVAGIIDDMNKNSTVISSVPWTVKHL
jgi:hypothetical protein